MGYLQFVYCPCRKICFLVSSLSLDLRVGESAGHSMSFAVPSSFLFGIVFETASTSSVTLTLRYKFIEIQMLFSLFICFFRLLEQEGCVFFVQMSSLSSIWRSSLLLVFRSVYWTSWSDFTSRLKCEFLESCFCIAIFWGAHRFR